MSRRWGGGPGPAGPSGAPDGGSPLSLTADQAEDLLAGRPGPAGSQALAGVLAALAGPAEPREAELAGYERIRQVFEAAGTAGAASGAGARTDSGTARGSRGGARSVSGPRPGRGLALRAGALAATLSVAGVGTAAAANSLPSGLQQFAHDVFGGLGVPAPSDEPGVPWVSATPSGPAAPTPTLGSGRTNAAPEASGRTSAIAPGAGTPTAGGNSAGVPTGSAAGNATVGATTGAPTGAATGATEDPIALCQAYDSTKKGEGLTAEQLSRLTALAGKEQHIAKYCKDLLAANAAASPTSASAGSQEVPAAASATTTTTSKSKGNSKPKKNS